MPSPLGIGGGSRDGKGCTQGTKELLETVAHSPIFQSQCSPATPKTVPVSPSQQDTRPIAVSSPQGSRAPLPSTPTGCSGRQARETHPCPPSKGFLARNTSCMLGSLAYLHPHGTLIFSDSSELGFLPLP
ncbi:palmitoyltransferase ZDHHC18-A-like [Clupea harengus]|uniref:Palmitoyltransferase ZDHHC18-A-like n=1 Tax=Clupea harengus TaxID=7950 RepID=A0A8M1KM61_CLUHA|nr:palmitoyltransferase ZDHHC18-A-like [Clupea harengus]